MPMGQEIVSGVQAQEPAHVALRVEIARTGVRQFVVAQKVGISEGQLSRLLRGLKPLSPELEAQIRAAIVEVAAA